ncbi:type II toxin-antitoxin system RelE/ParE family toxin [Acetobacteraceae bacterium B3987]|nr:type II toxin-antitoxin system RelE/ParE family toxin [Acetobacteraceae bacterium B3987]
MLEIRQTSSFQDWLAKLKDQRAIAKIKARLTLMQAGSFGDVKPCGGGVSESRIHYGPGYRLYFVQRGSVLVIMLGGGTKRTQSRDIQQAKDIAVQLEGQL